MVIGASQRSATIVAIVATLVSSCAIEAFISTAFHTRSSPSRNDNSSCPPSKPLVLDILGTRSKRLSSAPTTIGRMASDRQQSIVTSGTPPSSLYKRRARRKKKTLRDRSPEEATNLIRDIVQATVEAGPRAGPARTLDAYLAVTRTIQDFLPFGLRREQFSAPLALRKLFERLGATYIKLGQFIASSPTLFPKEYVLEFQNCLDATEPLEWDVIKKVIETETGTSLQNSFLRVDKTPLASASIAQVHAATLISGEDVVIKVQKPGIDASLKADLSFVYVASRLLEFLQPDFERTSLSAIAEDVRTSMLEELDFEKEASNLEEFRAFLIQKGLQRQATAPKVYRKFTTKKILTMERLYGVSMLDIESISKITKNPEIPIITALNVWTTSVMTMPWFHADVHAGNLLVLKDGRVGFIDFGIVGRIGKKTFRAVKELSDALSLGNYEGMAMALCNMGATDEKVDIKQFARDIERVMMNFSSVQYDATASFEKSYNDRMQSSSIGGYDENEITKVLLDIVDVTEDNGLKLPREFGLLVKQSLYFDRYLKILAPNLDIMGDSRVDLAGSNSVQVGRDENIIDV